MTESQNIQKMAITPLLCYMLSIMSLLLIIGTLEEEL